MEKKYSMDAQIRGGEGVPKIWALPKFNLFFVYLGLPLVKHVLVKVRQFMMKEGRGAQNTILRCRLSCLGINISVPLRFNNSIKPSI